MENIFSIEIRHNGAALTFDARLDTIGFVHKILIKVNGIDVTFEPDEERNYRAMVQPSQMASLKEPDMHIIAAIGAEMNNLSPGQVTAGGTASGELTFIKQ